MSLTIINIENRETKLNVHEGYTKSKKGEEDQQAHLGISTRLTPSYYPLHIQKAKEKPIYQVSKKKYNIKSKATVQGQTR